MLRIQSNFFRILRSGLENRIRIGILHKNNLYNYRLVQKEDYIQMISQKLCEPCTDCCSSCTQVCTSCNFIILILLVYYSAQSDIYKGINMRFLDGHIRAHESMFLTIAYDGVTSDPKLCSRITALVFIRFDSAKVFRN